ncbi:MAG TPA: inositol monophosphatase [Casimicrobiaceae bacterium]|jgi:myo-inositol-1(or 4)-monophosphatase|nr:inositol monophosphatase [Casimicrobiaceae bacterium]
MKPHLELLGGAEAIAARAAATLTAMRGTAIDVTRKELRDVVTDADLASERVVLDGLRALTPDVPIVSEEAGATGPEHGRARWIVDPLDGTVNYAAGLPWFSVTLAYQQDGITRVGVTHAPAAGIVARYAEGGVATINGRTARVSDRRSLADAVVSIVLTSHYTDREVERTAEAVRRLGSAARGVRIIVSGGLEMTLVADGQLDAFISLKADVVSHAAAMPLVRAAGGRVTRLDGRDAVDEDGDRVASHGAIHDALLERLRGI